MENVSVKTIKKYCFIIDVKYIKNISLSCIKNILLGFFENIKLTIMKQYFKNLS